LVSKSIGKSKGKSEHSDRHFSKMCLIYGVISFLSVDVALAIYRITQRSFSFESIDLLFLQSLPYLIIFTIGIACGIISLISKQKAEFEPDNKLRDAGSVLCKLGLGFNFSGLFITMGLIVLIGRNILMYG
jgi:hypothetical protein